MTLQSQITENILLLHGVRIVSRTLSESNMLQAHGIFYIFSLLFVAQ